MGDLFNGMQGYGFVLCLKSFFKQVNFFLRIIACIHSAVTIPDGKWQQLKVLRWDSKWIPHALFIWAKTPKLVIVVVK